MKVNGYGTIKPSTSVRRSGSASAASSFSDLLSAAQADSGSGVHEAGDVSATTNLSGLLALQEVSEEERKRERLVKQGKNMLDSLERLRQQLLIGEIPAHILPDLANNLSAQKETVMDPQLLGLIEEIELRVAVELAKLEMAFAARAEIDPTI